MSELHPVISVRLFTDEKCFGPGIAQLLHGVEELHSLRAAAAKIGMAYSKAWTILRDSQQALGFPLLNSTTGGKNGGGASLTEDARRLLAAYETYCTRLRQQAQELFDQVLGDVCSQAGRKTDQ